MNKKVIYIILSFILVLLIASAAIWFFFFRSTAAVSTGGIASNGFGSVPDTTNTTPANTDNSGNQTINTTSTAAAQKIFKISDGPIVGATMMQTLRPTTTISRYIRQDDGHVFDVPLGVAGAVPRVVSNITIPGGQRAIWLEGGNAAIMQYVDDTNVVKTVYLGFPAATTTGAILPTRIQFLPDNIVDIAGSPDGKSVVYLIKTASGSDGYIAQSSGLNSRKSFSLPLSQLLVSWPSSNTILVQTKSAAGIAGIVFSVNATSHAVSQLVTAAGLTATADPAFSELVYTKSDGTNQFTYVHNIQHGTDSLLSFSPIPERCIWSRVATSTMYCATPLQYVGPNYLDQWHAGTAGYADSIFSFKVSSGANVDIASPGSTDGGTSADILEMALSPNEQYLSYTTKGDRSLWAVTLGN
jgi:hypothetical protein